jgi:peptide-methionine (R)-S-oxide reductase
MTSRLRERDLPQQPAILRYALQTTSCLRVIMAEAIANPKIVKSDMEWRQQLTPEQYHVTRKHGTERAFTGPYWNEKSPGEYACVCCGAKLFSSSTKYDSGTGWPSFYAPVDEAAVSEHVDGSWLMRRTEIRCSSCDAHLGHVFPDGPKPTGQRYCMNGTSLTFAPVAEKA